MREKLFAHEAEKQVRRRYGLLLPCTFDVVGAGCSVVKSGI